MATPRSTRGRKTAGDAAAKSAGRRRGDEAAAPVEKPARGRRGGASARQVRIRMHRQGLGDCFLLSFPRDGKRDLHLMIDFGVLLGTQNASERMAAVAAEIEKATGGEIDVLVATHEHWDHVSGFEQAKQVFEDERLRVEEVWLAWTEDDAHPLAKELRGDRERKVKHLRRAVKQMAAFGFGERARAVEEVLGFFGDLGVEEGELALDGLPAAKAGGSTRDAMAYLAGGLRDARVLFRRPGEPVFTLPGTDARVYVLGPPEDRTLIKRSDPTKRGAEVYEKQQHFALSLADSFFAALGVGDGAGATGEDAEIADLSFPFDRQHRVDPKQAEEEPFFRRYYGFGDGDAGRWRRIDDDWLGVTADLALALDGDTNNTSLALAFELGEGGPVLLFPADAQVGNWLSWDNVSWPRDPARPGAGTVTAADLLKRAVVYKVGHHGSHNATLREKGLERMESPDLVALIPVEKEMAAKKRWDMPFPPLYERLKEKARGRVIRVDDGLPGEGEAVKKFGLTAREWKEFEARTTVDDLWIELRVDY